MAFVTDLSGQVLVRQCGGTHPQGYSPFRGGAPSAYANFDASYEPFNPSNVGGGASAYTVRGGETLQSIAQGLWGDASLWYKIADANGLSGSEPLIEGDSLVIPGKVSSIHQTAKTFRPYDPSRAIGDLSPTQAAPPPPADDDEDCGPGQIFVAIIAIAVACTVGPYAVGMFLPEATAATATVGSIYTAGLAAIASGSGGLAVVAGLAIGGAAASVVSQGVGIAIGVQKDFSWEAVAMGAIGGAIGGGLSGWTPIQGAGTFVNSAIRAAASNTLTQGVEIAVGLKDRFDWTSVAVAGVMGGVGASVGDMLQNSLGASSSIWVNGGFANRLVSGTAGAIAGAGAKSLIDGSDFGKNLRTLMPDVIGQTVGAMITGGIAAAQQRADKTQTSAEQAFAEGDAALERADATMAAMKARWGAPGEGNGIPSNGADGEDLRKTPAGANLGTTEGGVLSRVRSNSNAGATGIETPAAIMPGQVNRDSYGTVAESKKQEVVVTGQRLTFSDRMARAGDDLSHLDLFGAAKETYLGVKWLVNNAPISRFNVSAFVTSSMTSAGRELKAEILGAGRFLKEAARWPTRALNNPNEMILRPAREAGDFGVRFAMGDRNALHQFNATVTGLVMGPIHALGDWAKAVGDDVGAGRSTAAGERFGKGLGWVTAQGAVILATDGLGEAFAVGRTAARSSEVLGAERIAAERSVATRIDYSRGFDADLANFKPGANLQSGILDTDLNLVSYHADVPLGAGRSAKWWTTPETANGFSTIDDVRQGLALPPEWGAREAVSYARIPRGTNITSYVGTASPQVGVSGEIYGGGATQYRFKDFDPAWIVAQRRIP